MADESANYGDVLGTGAPMRLGERRASADFPELDKLVGSEYPGRDGFVFRLVRLNIAAGLTAAEAECRLVAYSAETDGASPLGQDVELAVLGGTAPLNRPVGMTVPEQEALSDNDLFLVVVDGPYMWGTLGDDAGDIAVGEYVQLDDDADKGKMKTTDTTHDASGEHTIGRAIDIATADNEQFRFRPIRKLRA